MGVDEHLVTVFVDEINTTEGNTEDCEEKNTSRVADGMLIMYPSASRRTAACARSDIPLMLGSASSEARNGARRRIKAENLARTQCFLDFISVKCFKDVEVLESTQRAPENAAQALKFVT